LAVQVEKASQVLAYLDRAVAAYSAARQAAPASSGSAEGQADGDAAAAASGLGTGSGEVAGAADGEELARYGFRSVEDVRARVCLYKARHFLFTRNVKVRAPAAAPLPHRCGPGQPLQAE
jgi:hypothetical protein